MVDPQSTNIVAAIATIMKPNVGGRDRQVRLVAGPVMVIVGFVLGLELLDPGLNGAVGLAIGTVLIVLGAVLVGSGVTQRCPVNAALGINTCERTP